MFLADELSKEELHAAMQKSFTLVNSSLSEGMSAAILEVCNIITFLVKILSIYVLGSSYYAVIYFKTVWSKSQ